MEESCNNRIPDGATKVHFPSEQLFHHDSEIVVQSVSPEELAVHLGFLQIHHHYEIRFVINDSLSEDVTFNALQNLHVKILSIVPTEDGLGHEVLCELSAYKEKIMKEVITLQSSDGSASLALTLHARVLGKGKGTPALKNGIRCTGIDIDEESELSDWQGFD